MGTADVPVVVVSDHPLVRAGLRSVFVEGSGVRVAAEAADGRGAPAMVAQSQAEALVLDLPLRRASATLTTRAVRALLPRVRVIFLASFVDERLQISTALAGAYCCLERDLDARRLVDAIRGTEGAPIPATHAAWAPAERLLRDWDTGASVTGSAPRDIQLVRLALQGMTDPELLAAVGGTSVDQVRRQLVRLHERLVGAPAP